MSWYNPLDWVGQVGTLLGTGQTEAQLQAENDRLQQATTDLNKRELAIGKINADQYNELETANVNGSIDVNQQVTQAAQDGALEGIKSLPSKVRSVVGGALDWSLAWIPWEVWVILAIALFFWLDGHLLVKSWLKRKYGK